MKKTELITRIALVGIVLFSLVAVILQIANERTNAIETTYEIITFSVGITALTIAVLQGLSNAKTTRELNRMAREIRESVSYLRVIDSDGDRILDGLAENNRIDHRILEVLKEHDIGANDDARRVLAAKIGGRIAEKQS